MSRPRLLISAALTAAGLGLTAVFLPTASAVPVASDAPKPTVVLVHGAWADASGWSSVVKRLQKDGYPVVAPANPLRSLSADSSYLAAYLKSISGPIILVGHSYGGAVITNAATDNPNVKSLVYIAAFAPDQGESIGALSARFPGSHLTDDPAAPVPTALSSVPFAQTDGSPGVDLYLKPNKFSDVFLSDHGTTRDAAALAATQRPIAAQALGETSGAPAWKTIPSWYLVAKNDHAIPTAAERFMADRAHSHTVEIDAPHGAQLTNPGAVTHLIESASKRTAQ
ncbi:alpha/beta hydrolase [Streptomyces sp. NBC_00208]|uniref:alpha/beta fold hydrolase n=1 Tax=Streptomyces sp. NBC_00208 TaxID=2975681 RepID=UPI002E28F860|nr:alpha/beta hydrolase [Streptomyces sp. NBC_00208]